MKKPIVFGLVVLIAVAIGAWLLSILQPSHDIRASGTIEAIQSDISPKVQGRLIALREKDGAAVRKGQVVAVLEEVNPALSVAQARAGVASAQAQVASAQAAYGLQRDTYETSVMQAREGVSIAQSTLAQAGETLGIETHSAALGVDQAQAQVLAARSTYDRAAIELKRARSLVSTGDEPQRALDDANAGYRGAVAQLQSARDALALAQAERRNVNIRELGVAASHSQQRQSVAQLDAMRAQWQLVQQRRAQLLGAQAQLAQAGAALALAQNDLRETRLVAPFDGYIVSHNFEVGDLVAPGAAVMTIGDLNHPYLYVYVTESDLPHIKTGMRADVKIDGMPDRTFVGYVSQINDTSEFTPENVQTQEERIEYLVFRVKIQFTDTTGALKPGLPADAVFRI